LTIGAADLPGMTFCQHRRRLGLGRSVQPNMEQNTKTSNSRKINIWYKAHQLSHPPCLEDWLLQKYTAAACRPPWQAEQHIRVEVEINAPSDKIILVASKQLITWLILTNKTLH